MKFFSSVWYAGIVGAVFITLFVLTGGGMVNAIIYMVALTIMNVMSTLNSSMWRKTATEIASY
mgnify:CR=1 FL=1